MVKFGVENRQGRLGKGGRRKTRPSACDGKEEAQGAANGPEKLNKCETLRRRKDPRPSLARPVRCVDGDGEGRGAAKDRRGGGGGEGGGGSQDTDQGTREPKTEGIR